jgi:hypothetical protein
MTEEKTIDRKTRDNKKENKKSIMTEDELQRHMKKIDGRTKSFKVKETEVAAFQCTRNGTDRYSVTLYNPELTVDLNIRDVLPEEQAVEFVEKYKDGQKVYATLVNIIIGESEKTYLGDISVNEEDARSVYNTFQSREYEDVSFSVREKGDRLVYGREQIIRKYLPNSLDSSSFRVSKSDNTVIKIFSILGFLFFAGQAVSGLLFLLTFLTGIALILIGAFFARGTNDIYRTDIEPEKLRANPNTQITVLECEYTNTDSSLVIEQIDEDGAKWVFNKKENGELTEEGKTALKQMRKIGSSNRAMIPVSKPEFTDVNYILSEDSEYTILN